MQTYYYHLIGYVKKKNSPRMSRIYQKRWKSGCNSCKEFDQTDFSIIIGDLPIENYYLRKSCNFWHEKLCFFCLTIYLVYPFTKWYKYRTCTGNGKYFVICGGTKSQWNYFGTLWSLSWNFELSMCSNQSSIFRRKTFNFILTEQLHYLVLIHKYKQTCRLQTVHTTRTTHIIYTLNALVN